MLRGQHQSSDEEAQERNPQNIQTQEESEENLEAEASQVAEELELLTSQEANTLLFTGRDEARAVSPLIQEDTPADKSASVLTEGEDSIENGLGKIKVIILCENQQGFVKRETS